MQTLSKQPVTMRALIEALFAALGDAGERGEPEGPADGD
jgi:hypothetical protein